MAWLKEDENSLKECKDKLQEKESVLQAECSKIHALINNISKIQTKEYKSYDNNRKETITYEYPLDQWGEKYTDEEKTKTLKKCIDMTKVLLK